MTKSCKKVELKDPEIKGFFSKKRKNMSNPSQYIKEVKQEMSHVSFPTKKKTLLFTVLVVVFSLVVALALGLFDFAFKAGIEKLLNF